jgi:hypothetical protein
MVQPTNFMNRATKTLDMRIPMLFCPHDLKQGNILSFTEALPEYMELLPEWPLSI